MRGKSLAILAILTLTVVCPSPAQNDGDGIVRLPNLWVNTVDKYVAVLGNIPLPGDKPIEVGACTQYGKTHETVVTIWAQPSHIKAGMIMLGIPDGKPSEWADRQGQPMSAPDRAPVPEGARVRPPEGEKTRILVEYEERDFRALQYAERVATAFFGMSIDCESAVGKPVRRQLEDLIYNPQTKKHMKRLDWIYVGSQMVGGDDRENRQTFLADHTGTVVTTFFDPGTIFDNADPETGGDDKLFYTSPVSLPAVGTPVKIIFLPVKFIAE